MNDDQNLAVRVVRAEDLTPAVRLFEFARMDGGSFPQFTAGAHIDVQVGDSETRSYSLISSPHRLERYTIAVARDDVGRGGSRWMHDHLHLGAIAYVTAPKNNFHLNEDADTAILIAGGIGVTPLLAMSRRLAELKRPTIMYYCTRSAQDTAFKSELSELLGTALIVHHDDGIASNHFDFTSCLEAVQPGSHVYVCGPAGFVDAVRTASRHWPQDQVHYEIFATPKAATGSQMKGQVRDTDFGFEIELSRSGKIFHVPPTKSILQVLLENGFKVAHICTEGWCGNCRVRMISGRAEHRDEILEDEEKDNNTAIQTCVSRALPNERLVLDL